MSNMSYCRFENTVIDLRDCKLALEEMINNPCEENSLNKREEDAAKELLILCVDIVTLICDQSNDLEIDDLDEKKCGDAILDINDACKK